MLNKVDFKYLVGAFISFTLGLGTMHGVVQNCIHFSGINNEMGFAFMAMFAGCLFTFGIKK